MGGVDADTSTYGMHTAKLYMEFAVYSYKQTILVGGKIEIPILAHYVYIPGREYVLR